MCEKYPNTEFFWSEYGKRQTITNSIFGYFSRSVISLISLYVFEYLEQLFSRNISQELLELTHVRMQN